MITSHQPAIFNGLPVVAAASSLKNGSMSFGERADAATIEAVRHNRSRWLAELGMSLEQSTLVRVTYGNDVNYTRIKDVGQAEKGRGMSLPNGLEADAMFTSDKNHALFLPLADCGGIVLYDAKNQVLGVVHLGRQATFAGLAQKAIEHMQKIYNSNPADTYIWISPSIAGDSYWLHTFQFAHEPAWRAFSRPENSGWLVDLQAYNQAQFIEAGVPKNQIEHAGIDTANHADYPSHYRYQTHNETHKAGRFAIVAFMK